MRTLLFHAFYSKPNRFYTHSYLHFHHPHVLSMLRAQNETMHYVVFFLKAHKKRIRAHRYDFALCVKIVFKAQYALILFLHIYIRIKC